MRHKAKSLSKQLLNLYHVVGDRVIISKDKFCGVILFNTDVTKIFTHIILDSNNQSHRKTHKNKIMK